MAPATPWKFSLKSLGSEIVNIYVEPKYKNFPIHKKILCDRSEHFSKAFNGDFKEGLEQTMRLPKESPNTFEDFITWLYRGNLPSWTSKKRNYVPLYRCFFLAEKLRIDCLCNVVIGKIQDIQKERAEKPDREETLLIYESTREGS
ncbi:hypothetical protein G7Y89_g2884 [Cudoniella acicularis]|uniref:BTB domain-containing protein n=1 Tax=Cudoniella acicularis TaxID=354080 RepID=A0A8H4RVF9_9HELO|nr:hypothetical protein G7Y89_g2884 [Cudoniella acicularis]